MSIERKIERLATNFFTSGLKKFSNIHQGEACYIFGDGPSIKWFDLGLFSDHPALCCGFLPFHKDFHKLNVKYLMMIEPWLFAPKPIQPKRMHPVRAIAAEYRKMIEATPDKQFFVHLSNAISLTGPNVNYVFRGLPGNRNQTDRTLNKFDLFAGSFHATMTLAYYLGFSKVHLVGFDGWTIQPARNRHWYEFGPGEPFAATNFATDFLEILKAKMEIYTISFDGQSRNVTNVSYETFTKKKPEFKENYELLDSHYLKALAEYDQYKIFAE